MNEDHNQNFRQYGFSQYEQPQAAPARFSDRSSGGVVGQMMKSPLVATVALLLAGAAFAGIVISAYPSDEGQDAVPVVQADTLAFKEAADNPGGMDIANRDNTVFMSMNGEELAESAPMEGDMEAFAQQVEDVIAEDQQAAAMEGQLENLLDAQDQGENIEQLAVKTDQVDMPMPSVKPDEPVENVQDLSRVAAADAQPPASATAPSAAPAHKPGASPETLEFVKSVLDKKDGRVAAAAPATRAHDVSDAAMGAASIQPAAGAAKPAAITPGDYYVQLASVTSAAGAEGEWGKLQKAFASELSGLEHRVKSADLGERGTFYRIQAGPMSKESANSLCDSIKAQKPGGCLVTK